MKTTNFFSIESNKSVDAKQVSQQVSSPTLSGDLDSKLNTYRVFHGNNVFVKNPKIYTVGQTKDFGYGFYITMFQSQANKWAMRKSRFG